MARRAGKRANGVFVEFTDDVRQRGPKRGRQIYRIFVEFTTADGQKIQAVNYASPTNRTQELSPDSFDSSGRAVRDLPVEVSYFPAVPHWAVYRHGRLTRFLPESVFVIMFPLLLYVPAFIVRKERKELRKILSQGVGAKATVSEPVLADMNRKQSERNHATLTFDAPQGPRTTVYYGYYLEIKAMTLRPE